MPITALLKYNGHRWVTPVATITNLVGLSMWLWVAPGLLAFAACSLLQLSLVMLVLRYRAAANFFRMHVEQDLAGVVGKALFTEYQGKLDAKPLPSDIMKDAMKDILKDGV